MADEKKDEEKNKDKKDEPGESGGFEPDPTDNCTVCLDDLTVQTCSQLQPCKHMFHLECVQGSLKTHGHECPTCRADVTGMVGMNGKKMTIPKMSRAASDRMRRKREEAEPDGGFINVVDVVDMDDDWLTDGEDLDLDWMMEERPGSSTMRDPPLIQERRATRSTLRIEDSPMDIARNRFISGMADNIASTIGQNRGRRPIVHGRASSQPRVGGRRGNGEIVPEIDLEEMEAQLGSAIGGRRRATIESDDDEEIVRVTSRRRTQFVSTSEEESEDESDDDSEETDGEEGSTEEDSELDDDDIMDDDQPGTSRPVMERVERKKRGSKKKKKTTKRKPRRPRSTNTCARTSLRRRTNKSKEKEKKKKEPKKKRPKAEENAEQRHRLHSALPSLSMNGDAIEPVVFDVSDGEERPDPVPYRPSPPSTSRDSNDPLGAIMGAINLTMAPGRHIRQENGRFVPTESFENYEKKIREKMPPMLLPKKKATQSKIGQPPTPPEEKDQSGNKRRQDVPDPILRAKKKKERHDPGLIYDGQLTTSTSDSASSSQSITPPSHTHPISPLPHDLPSDRFAEGDFSLNELFDSSGSARDEEFGVNEERDIERAIQLSLADQGRNEKKDDEEDSDDDSRFNEAYRENYEMDDLMEQDYPDGNDDENEKIGETAETSPTQGWIKTEEPESDKEDDIIDEPIDPIETGKVKKEITETTLDDSPSPIPARIKEDEPESEDDCQIVDEIRVDKREDEEEATAESAISRAFHRAEPRVDSFLVQAGLSEADRKPIVVSICTKFYLSGEKLDVIEEARKYLELRRNY